MTMIIHLHSLGIAARSFGPPALGFRLRASGLGRKVRQGCAVCEMNDPVDTYASTTSCMQDQLNRYPATTLLNSSCSDTVQ